MWPEVHQAQEEKRYELVLTGDDVNKKIEAQGCLDPDLYQLSQLNFLRVSKSPLTSISDDIGQLTNLTNLILQGNKLESLPETFGQLLKLKLLDVSMNFLESLPNGIGTLTSLSTINAIGNKLSSLPSLEKCVSLTVLDVSDNNLTDFPDICHEELVHLADVKFANNQIPNVPNNLSVLSSLKILDLGNNTIKTVPGETVDCIKLKDLNMKGNPLTDRRFRKLVEADRCVPRQVLDYIRQHCPRTQEGKATGKGKKGKGGKRQGNDDDQVDILCNEMQVMSVKEELPVVVVTEAVKDVRPYIVCCVIRGVDLSGDNLRKFISVQTKLHEGICERRLAATIATHDLAKIKGPLLFSARVPEEIRIHPLVRGKEVSARQLYAGLSQEAEAQRKQQKRNNVTGIHKFLHLVEKWTLWPCLTDTAGTVVSLPPITNSELTKISQETVNVFMEVTSSTSLGKAKQVMDSLVTATLYSGICPEKNAGGKTVLSIQQVRVQNEDGGLRVLYPSRTDLDIQDDKIRVVMPDKSSTAV